MVLLVLLACLVWRSSRPAEPIFEGVPLTQWLDHHVASSAAIPPYNSPGWKAADEALRQIGTNGIPILLERLRTRDYPSWMRTPLALARKFGWTERRSISASWWHEEAAYAFRLLGTNAAGAVPELIRIYEADISPSSRENAATALGHMGKHAQAALPVLIEDFHHTNHQTRWRAVTTVAHIGGNADLVVPALTKALHDPEVNVRWNALFGLDRFGGRARSAAPEAAKLLNDDAVIGSSPIKGQAETSLWRIAPEKVGHPLVIEDPTPMVSDGVTTQALKVDDRGTRRAIIQPGLHTPLVRQHWSSDPRPHLSLYRGRIDTEDQDVFLGHFEVLGLPDEDSLNVSTLFILAEGRLVLAARNNRDDQFLHIRRARDKELP